MILYTLASFLIARDTVNALYNRRSYTQASRSSCIVFVCASMKL